ncbi:MAG: hypothetical protein LBU77_07425 [Clostridiales bacterium]|jgi:hypothetical protein|nr:hypothetical protein [Clostridiales bacterium]
MQDNAFIKYGNSEIIDNDGIAEPLDVGLGKTDNPPSKEPGASAISLLRYLIGHVDALESTLATVKSTVEKTASGLGFTGVPVVLEFSNPGSDRSRC